METFASLRLNENKDRFIQKNTVLTDEQKQEVLDFFHSHANLEAKVNNGNWNYSIPYEEFKRVMASVDTQAKRMKKQSKELRQSNGLESLIEGNDYIVFKNTPEYTAYKPLNHKAMRIIASNMVEPKLWCESSIMTWTPKEVLPANEPMKDDLYPGAKWCVAMETDQHWINYRNQGLSFIVVCQKNPQVADTLKKICFVTERGEIDWNCSVNAADEDLSGRYRNVDPAIAEIAEEIASELREEYEREKETRVKVATEAFVSMKDAKITNSPFSSILQKDTTIADKECTLGIIVSTEDLTVTPESFEEFMDVLTEVGTFRVILSAKEDFTTCIHRLRSYIGNVLDNSSAYSLEGPSSYEHCLYKYSMDLSRISDFPKLQEDLVDAIEEALKARETIQDKIMDFSKKFNFKWNTSFTYGVEASQCMRDSKNYTLIIFITPGLAKEVPEVQLMAVLALKNNFLVEMSDEEAKKLMDVSLEDPDIDCRRADYKFACITSIDENNIDRVLDKVKDTFEELAYKLDHLGE